MTRTRLIPVRIWLVLGILAGAFIAFTASGGFSSGSGEFNSPLDSINDRHQQATQLLESMKR